MDTPWSMFSLRRRGQPQGGAWGAIPPYAKRYYPLKFASRNSEGLSRAPVLATRIRPRLLIWRRGAQNA